MSGVHRALALPLVFARPLSHSFACSLSLSFSLSSRALASSLSYILTLSLSPALHSRGLARWYPQLTLTGILNSLHGIRNSLHQPLPLPQPPQPPPPPPADSAELRGSTMMARATGPGGGGGWGVGVAAAAGKRGVQMRAVDAAILLAAAVPCMISYKYYSIWYNII